MPAKGPAAQDPRASPPTRPRRSATPVSRETVARLDRFVALLLQWQAKTNLVGASTFPHLGRVTSPIRCSSSTLHRTRTHWVDLGSGGGFPGMVMACALGRDARRHGASRREQRQESGVPARGRARHRRARQGASRRHRGNSWIEFRGPRRLRHRAGAGAAKETVRLTPRPDASRREALFLKGQDVEAELTEATKYWNIKPITPFQPDRLPQGCIVTRPDRATQAAATTAAWQPAA